MLVVADTGPINYLVLIEYIDILPSIHERVLIPTAVHNELINALAPEQVRRWANNLPDWIEVLNPEPSKISDESLASLHSGEREAIRLAFARQPVFLLMDDQPARKVASRLGLAVTGTLGILDEAAHRKLISFHDAIDRLKTTSFRYPATLVERLLAEHALLQK